MKKIEISTDGARGCIKIDGIDVSDIAQEIVYIHRAGEIPTVNVKFLAPDLSCECVEGRLIPNDLPAPYDKFYVRKIEKGSMSVKKE